MKKSSTFTSGDLPNRSTKMVSLSEMTISSLSRRLLDIVYTVYARRVIILISLLFVSVCSDVYMPPVDMTDEQIMALILNYLIRRRCWGKKYFQRQRLVRYLGQEVLGDGREVTRCLDELIQFRWINPRKKGETISLNVSYKREIIDHKTRYDTND